MNDSFLTLAENFEKIAAVYRKLATSSTKADTTMQPYDTESKPEIKLHIEDVRAVLAEKSLQGKTNEVKALLMKYNAGKLSGVKPEDYEALLKEAEVL